jgi:3-methyladenine DNA glycosylase AlkD
MASVQSVMAELKAKASESTRRIYVRHGAAADRVFGVSIAHLKVIAKKIKGEQRFACELFDTGSMDAMYLAGLVADGAQLSRPQLDAWSNAAKSLPMVAEYTIPWLAAEHPTARSLALKWMKSKDESVAAGGWCTYSGIVATTDDEDLDLDEIAERLAVIAKEIHKAKNRVRHAMNNFVIAVGTHVKPLVAQAKKTAQKIGPITVDMGETACQVPLATTAIAKAESSGKLGNKRKTMRC